VNTKAPATIRLGRGPRWRGTLLYPAVLVSLFLGCQGLAGWLGVPEGQRASLAALPTVLALVLSLPWRLRRAWIGAWIEDQPWRRLGISAPDAAPLGRALLRGLLKALLLLALVLLGLQLAGQIAWHPHLNPGLVLNGIALGLGVGLAEELLFRGWLLGELTLLVGGQRALWLQAALFSLVHTRFNLPVLQLLALLGGLLWLGLALGLQRRADGGLLWGAVGLHGGLVGGWFLIQQGLVSLNPSVPAWLAGPGGLAPNPIGGLLGWLGLSLLLLARRRWWVT
jgi:membrane protease YdiL (CAAX protease family)